MNMIKLLISFILVLILTSCSMAVESDKAEYEKCLEKCLGSETFLPSNNEVVNKDIYDYKYYTNRDLFAGCGIVVSEKVDKESFDQKQKQINEYYEFLSEPVVNYSGDTYVVIPEVNFEIQNYSFLVIADKTGVSNYPKCFGMIAMSKKDGRVLYFSYYSQDLDFIDDMYDFVNKNFPGWDDWG